jgi:hypothetical protein
MSSIIVIDFINFYSFEYLRRNNIITIINII